MEEFPYAWAFFVPFILIATFTMLNLFIAVIVNAVQTMHDDEIKDEIDAEKATQQQLLEQMQQLQQELQALRQDMNKPRE
jgi:voltage-gated sodium channel